MADISETLRAGVEHHRAGRLTEAEEMYRRVLLIHPRHAGAVHLLGLIAFQLGKHDVAVEYLTAAIKVDAFHAPFSADLGEIYRAMGKIPEAIASYQQSIRLNPEVADAQNNLGTLFETSGQLQEATACFREALLLNPRYGEAYGNLGNVLESQGQFPLAQAALEKAVELAPDNAKAYVGLGKCLSVEGNWERALDCYQQATRLHPDLADAHYHAAQARLALGDFVEGWRDFEWRLRCPAPGRRTFPLPAWNGAELHGHRVLVHAEQGLGDTLQFIRYVPLMVERGGTAILDVPRQLLPLLEQSGFENLIREGELPPACHLQAPLLSLPRLLGTTLETIPAASAYLSAKPRLVAQWGQKLSEVSGFKVGIAWQGDPDSAHDRFRSIPLSEFEPLAALPGVRLISLQKKDGLDQLVAASERFEMVNFADAFDEAEGAFMDTAAIMANLDLVVTSDTAAAHLAGALGVPVWVALSTAANWRWMQDRLDSPWYPTMRLFRQVKERGWAGVFQVIAAELAALVEMRSTGSS
jgi:tetratricopeptide (TPR) repeat protein